MVYMGLYISGQIEKTCLSLTTSYNGPVRFSAEIKMTCLNDWWRIFALAWTPGVDPSKSLKISPFYIVVIFYYSPM